MLDYTTEEAQELGIEAPQVEENGNEDNIKDLTIVEEIGAYIDGVEEKLKESEKYKLELIVVRDRLKELLDGKAS